MEKNLLSVLVAAGVLSLPISAQALNMEAAGLNLKRNQLKFLKEMEILF